MNLTFTEFILKLYDALLDKADSQPDKKSEHQRWNKRDSALEVHEVSVIIPQRSSQGGIDDKAGRQFCDGGNECTKDKYQHWLFDLQ